MLCRFRARVLISAFGIAHDCRPAAFRLAARLVHTNVRPLTDSDLAWADVAFVSGMLVQKNNLLIILPRCRAHGKTGPSWVDRSPAGSRICIDADHVVDLGKPRN